MLFSFAQPLIRLRRADNQQGFQIRSLAVLMITALLATGCSGPDENRSTAQLSAEEIAALIEEYPVLGSEPAPPPELGANGSLATANYIERLPESVLHSVAGTASFYADTFEGQRTASGIPFRQNQLVAAHRGFPFGTILRVTNLGNDREVRVRIVDRGPFAKGAGGEERVIDLSRRAATELGFIDAGTANVRLEVLEWGEGLEGNS